METTFIKTVKGSVMEELFDSCSLFIVKYYTAVNEMENFNPNKKYKYEITIRHGEGTDAKELFSKAESIANKRWKQKYEALKGEFEQYKLESIKWSVEDFTTLEKEGWSITEEQAQEALEEMIQGHDCTIGITWDTVHYYYEQFGTEL